MPVIYKLTIEKYFARFSSLQIVELHVKTLEEQRSNGKPSVEYYETITLAKII